MSLLFKVIVIQCVFLLTLIPGSDPRNCIPFFHSVVTVSWLNFITNLWAPSKPLSPFWSSCTQNRTTEKDLKIKWLTVVPVLIPKHMLPSRLSSAWKVTPYRAHAGILTPLSISHPTPTLNFSNSWASLPHFPIPVESCTLGYLLPLSLGLPLLFPLLVSSHDQSTTFSFHSGLFQMPLVDYPLYLQ